VMFNYASFLNIASGNFMLGTNKTIWGRSGQNFHVVVNIV